MKILGIQINPLLGDKTANFQKVARILKANAHLEADLVVLPEIFNIGIDHKKFQETAEPLGCGETTMFLSGFAEQYGANIISSFITKEPDGTFKNTAVAVDKKGFILDSYSKIHLFNHYGCNESDYISKGNKPVIIEIDGIKTGLSICYDLRFPELYRAYAKKNVLLIITPAAWPYPRYEHWLSLNKARAIENQFFMVSVNQCGKVTPSRTNLGQSMIVNPWGEIIANAGSNEGIVFAEINLDEQTKLRNEFPVLGDIEPDCYNI